MTQITPDFSVESFNPWQSVIQTPPPGYKQTEVGVIPEDWEVKALGNFISLRRGHDLTETDRHQGTVPVMSAAGQYGFHDTAIAKGPGVVLGRSGASFGQAHYCQDDYWPHNTALYVTDFQGNDPLFTFYLLRGMDFSRHNTGGAQPSLNRNFINPIQIAVPEFPEQRAIATALSDVDALITALDRLIAKKRNIKQAAMQELLTGKRRLPGFRGEWEVRTLAEVCLKIQDGTHFSPSLGGNDYLYVTSTNIGFGVLDVSNAGRIDAAQHRAIYNRCDVRKGDLLLTKDGVNTGNAALNHLDEEISLLSSVAFLRFDSRQHVAGYYLQQILSPEGQKQIKQLMAGNAITRLTLEKIRRLRFAVPSLREQHAIAEILSDVDAEIAALEQKRDKTRLLKQGMMQELLTGRIRLL